MKYGRLSIHFLLLLVKMPNKYKKFTARIFFYIFTLKPVNTGKYVKIC